MFGMCVMAFSSPLYNPFKNLIDSSFAFGISSEPFHYTFTLIHLTPLSRFGLRGSVNVG